MNVDQQTEMAFMQEGGLRDDGANVDAVSGNEVPTGSMDQEVRDDIPARLSEGEYVVPADVVPEEGKGTANATVFILSVSRADAREVRHIIC